MYDVDLWIFEADDDNVDITPQADWASHNTQHEMYHRDWLFEDNA